MSEQEKATTSDVKTEEAQQAAGATPLDAAPLKGLLGTKVGMTRVFLEDGQMVPVTVVSSEGVVVTQVKSQTSDGYNAVQVGYGDVEERKLTKPEAQHLAKKGLALKRWLREFRVADVAPFKVGQPVPVTVFAKGEWLQISGTNKGKGFAGAMKRHNFSGLPHSHGNGEYRRHPGTNGDQGHQHVIKGKKKPGHMGHVWSTVPKIQVVDVDVEKSLLLLRGSVPGPNGNIIVLRPTSRTVKVVHQPAQAAKKKAKK